MATIESVVMTAEEFYEFVHRPENRDRVFELERGEIVEITEMTKPGKFHGFVCANIAFILGLFVRDRKKGYVCTNDNGVVVERDPDTVRGPDVLFYEDANSAEQIDRKYGETPPLLAIEVLSPNDTYGNIMRRVREQLAFGTALVWVVDPDAENVSVHRSGKEAYPVESDAEITGEDVIPDLCCKVAEFFAMPGK